VKHLEETPWFICDKGDDRDWETDLAS